MNPIELNILWIPQDKLDLLKLGIGSETEADAEIQPITFFRIDNIQPYDNDNGSFTVVVSGGQEYVADMPYTALKKKLEEHYSIK